MSELELFNLGDSGSMRFGATDEGEPYVIASDFAKALGHRDAANALRLLDDGEKGTQIVSTSESSGRVAQRPVSVIYEDGMWELIFRSSLPGAKALKSRVKEILKEIRKTGSYGTQVELPQSYSEALRALADKAEALEVANQKIELDAPKVEGYEDLMGADGFFDMAAVAKSLAAVTGDLGRNNLLIAMRNMGIITKDSALPYQTYIDRGYFTVRVDVKASGAYPYAVATVKGLEWLRKKFRNMEDN